MAKSNFSVAIRFFICYSILLLSEETMKFSGVDAKTCHEGLLDVKVICDGSKVDQPCWDACQQRHGYDAKAYCKTLSPVLPNARVCYCYWPC